MVYVNLNQNNKTYSPKISWPDVEQLLYMYLKIPNKTTLSCTVYKQKNETAKKWNFMHLLTNKREKL